MGRQSVTDVLARQPRRRRALLRLSLACSFPLLLASPGFASTGGIVVLVRDAEHGAPLPGATVTLSNGQGYVPVTSELSDKNGMVRFPVLRAGTGYGLEISMPGFGGQRRANLRVRSNETSEIVVDLGMELVERVSVSATSSTVDLSKVGSETKFSDEFVEGLPIPGRFYQNVLQLAPGVNDEDGDGNPNVHGARSRNFRAEVSGVSNVDPLTGQWLNRVNPDSIEEIQVVPLGAGVEFGRAQGGFARVVQKQGTNSVEGVFNMLYRSSKLDGDGAGTNVDGAPSFDTYQPSIQVSGPIVKDKLWYRLSQEWIRREEPVNVLNDLAVVSRDQDISSYQLTWQASPRNKLALQYQSDPLTLDSLGIGTNVPFDSTQTLDTGGDTWTLNWVAPYSPRLLVDSTVAWQDTMQDVIPTTADVDQTCILFENITLLNDARCTDLGTSARVSGSHFETSLDERQRFTVRSQMTLFQSAGSHTHQLKLGLIVENERYFRDLTRRPDITLEVKGAGPGEPVGLPQIKVSVPPTSSARATGNSWGLYVEDQWRPRNNLTVNLGLRIDREEINARGRTAFDPEAEARAFEDAVDRNGQAVSTAIRDVFTAYEDINEFKELFAQALGIPEALVRPDTAAGQGAFWRQQRRPQDIDIKNTNFSPRLSVSWDPWANGKTKIALTAGRYFDKIFLAIPLVELEPLEATLEATDLPRLTFTNGQFLSSDATVPTTTLNARQVDRNLRTPYQDEWTVSIEREIFTETVLRAIFVNRKFEDQLQDRDINHAPGDKGRCVVPQTVGDEIVINSPDEGQPVVDPYTGEIYIDTDPGIGDGRIDDCTGDVVLRGISSVVDVPDGRPDLYTQNPGWREILLFGNFNSAEYRSFVLELVRRQYRSWEMQASYTWSEAIGDAAEFDLLQGNEQNLRDDERGFLDYDQRHVVKVNATTITPWLGGMRFGGVVRWESGLPYSFLTSKLTTFSTPPRYIGSDNRDLRARLRYPTGQRNDQRNGSFWTFDLLVSKDFRVGNHAQMQIKAEVFNLLNDDTLRVTEEINNEITGQRRFGRQWQLSLRVGF